MTAPTAVEPAGDEGHSIVAPSSAARRNQCPQSVIWEASIPEEDSEDAREGEAAHWAGAEQLHGRLVDVGHVAPNGIVLTAEMVEAADLYSDDVTRVLAKYGLKPRDGHIEARLRIPGIHERSFGTPDFYVLINQGPGRPLRLLLWDFKYGHRYVEVIENDQLVDYATGACADHHDTHPGVEITFTVVQPRSYARGGPVRRWETTLVDLRPLINRSANSAAEALGPSPRTRTGPECRDCRARSVCPQLQAESLACFDEAGRTLPLQMSADAMALELTLAERAIERLQARTSGLSAALERTIRAGQPARGYRLAPTQGREQWTVPAAQVIETARALSINVSRPAEPMTPNQARKAGMPAELVAAWSTRVSGVQLERHDPASLIRIFGKTA